MIQNLEAKNLSYRTFHRKYNNYFSFLRNNYNAHIKDLNKDKSRRKNELNILYVVKDLNAQKWVFRISQRLTLNARAYTINSKTIN